MKINENKKRYCFKSKHRCNPVFFFSKRCTYVGAVFLKAQFSKLLNKERKIGPLRVFFALYKSISTSKRKETPGSVLKKIEVKPISLIPGIEYNKGSEARVKKRKGHTITYDFITHDISTTQCMIRRDILGGYVVFKL